MSKWPYNTAAWQRLRKAKLSAQPLCEACERRGRTVLAKAVDHIVAINKGGDAFPALDGLMSLCTECHNSKTARMDRGNSKGGSRFKGCDINGNPLDDADEWYSEPQGSPPARETHDAVVDTSQHINARQRPALAFLARLGGFEGREAAAAGPTRETRKDLVLRMVRNKDEDRWV